MHVSMYVCKAHLNVLTNFIPSGYVFSFGGEILKVVRFLKNVRIMSQCRSVGRGRGGPGPPNKNFPEEHSPGLPKTSWLWRSWWAPPIILTLLRHCVMNTFTTFYCKGLDCIPKKLLAVIKHDFIKSLAYFTPSFPLHSILATCRMVYMPTFQDT